MRTVDGVLILSQPMLQKWCRITWTLMVNGPQDRRAAGVGMPIQSDPSQSAQVIFADADAAQGTSTDMGRRRKTLSQKAECQRWYSQDRRC